jgi:hypothetical protein
MAALSVRFHIRKLGSAPPPKPPTPPGQMGHLSDEALMFAPHAMDAIGVSKSLTTFQLRAQGSPVRASDQRAAVLRVPGSERPPTAAAHWTDGGTADPVISPLRSREWLDETPRRTNVSTQMRCVTDFTDHSTRKR